MYLDYTCNSDCITNLIHAEIGNIVRFSQRGHGAPKAQKSIFEKRPKSRRIAKQKRDSLIQTSRVNAGALER